MSPGTYISLTLHISLVGWLLFNGDFEHKPLELPVTEVSVVSSEMFDIIVNNTAPIIETELEAASRQPSIEDTQAPADSSTDKAPQQVTQMLSQIAQNDALPETVPNQPERMEEVVIIPPLELSAPKIEAEAPESLATSLPPKPRPAPRIAPVVVAPPAPDMDIGEITRDTAAPQLEPAQVLKEQTAKAPEAAAPEIVTEAEKPSEAVEVSKLAPPRSVRPQRRPAPRPVDETPIKSPETIAAPIDPLTAALAEALSAEIPNSSGQRPSSQLVDALNAAIGGCNNRGGLSSAAEETTIVVSVTFTADGMPVADTIKLLEHSGGSENNAKVRFEAYKRGILNSECRNKTANVLKKAARDEQVFAGVAIEFVVPPGQP